MTNKKMENTKQIELELVMGILDAQSKTLDDLNETNRLLVKRIKLLEERVDNMKLKSMMNDRCR